MVVGSQARILYSDQRGRTALALRLTRAITILSITRVILFISYDNLDLQVQRGHCCRRHRGDNCDQQRPPWCQRHWQSVQVGGRLLLLVLVIFKDVLINIDNGGEDGVFWSRKCFKGDIEHLWRLSVHSRHGSSGIVKNHTDEDRHEIENYGFSELHWRRVPWSYLGQPS